MWNRGRHHFCLRRLHLSGCRPMCLEAQSFEVWAQGCCRFSDVFKVSNFVLNLSRFGINTRHPTVLVRWRECIWLAALVRKHGAQRSRDDKIAASSGLTASPSLNATPMLRAQVWSQCGFQLLFSDSGLLRDSEKRQRSYITPHAL